MHDANKLFQHLSQGEREKKMNHTSGRMVESETRRDPGLKIRARDSKAISEPNKKITDPPILGGNVAEIPRSG